MVRISKRVGVVLFQLGGPDSLAAVEPFLYNLFCDPDIIDFPFSRIGRRPLAKLISSTRAKKAGQHYAAIGGGSPIRKFTERQAAALGSATDARRVWTHAAWWRCATGIRLRPRRSLNCRRREVDQVVLLPLYPQYSQHDDGQQSERVAAAMERHRPDFMRRDFLPQPALYRRAGGKN